MSKYNIQKVAANRIAASPLVAEKVAGVATYGGGQGVVADAKTELFKIAVNLFAGGEDTYYESGAKRDDRFIKLVEKLAITDPEWTVKLLIWLRKEANIRTAAVIGAAHFVHARLGNKKALEEDVTLAAEFGYTGLNRHVIAEVLSRADEPGEFVAYWISKWGDKLPKPVKRGVGDSILRLYNEYTVLKYDTASHALRFVNILNLTHVKPRAAVIPEWKLTEMSEEDIQMASAESTALKAELFRYIIDKSYDNKPDSSYELPMINANVALRKEAAKNKTVLFDAGRVKAAGMTWEDVLSLGGPNVDKKKLWESVIPSMGIFALVRNLRNFEEANISKESRDYVISQLTNPKVISKSRMFPFRFLSAFQNVNSLHYQAALETALDLTTQNIPVFDDDTLVLIDTSGSMDAPLSNKSKMPRAGAAALFGAAVAAKNPGKVDLVMFGTTSRKIVVKPGQSVLSIVNEVNRLNGVVGWGTETAAALSQHFNPKKHKRVFIFTDQQSFGGYYGSVANFNFGSSFAYAFDLAGYKTGDLPVGKDRKYQLAGLSDATFKLVPLLENMGEGTWPWDV